MFYLKTIEEAAIYLSCRRICNENKRDASKNAELAAIKKHRKITEYNNSNVGERI